MNRVFYVCSYGGSGSYMLCNWLREHNCGEVYHVHSRVPPKYLEFVGESCHFEWFNGKIIPDNQIKKYTVIYIYRNPVRAILSRFGSKIHLRNIQVKPDVVGMDFRRVIMSGQDLYEIEEFFDNYTNKNINANYDIIAIKYETFFNNIDIIKKVLNLPNRPIAQNPQNTETERPINKIYKKLERTYRRLINKFNYMPEVTIIKGSATDNN